MEKLARVLVFVTALSAPGLFGAGASAFEPDPILQNPVAPVGSFGEERLGYPRIFASELSLALEARPAQLRVAALTDDWSDGKPKFSVARPKLGVFESVAISAASLPAAEKWRSVTNSDFASLFSSRCLADGFSQCDSAFVRRLHGLVSRASGMEGRQILELVNAEINAAVEYVADRGNWGRGDYWANPMEIASRGAGDCEDYAIAKMWLLRSLGFPAGQLQLVVLSDTRRRLYHAVLVAHLDGRAYVLDNLSSNLATDAAYSSYLPIMSFVAGKSYIHGFENRSAAFADLPTDLSAVSPGEGI